MFDDHSEAIIQNHILAGTTHNGGENAKKPDFEFIIPLQSNLQVCGFKFDEISWQYVTFSKTS